MSFVTEPTGYRKTALSDLQGAWILLREEVVEHYGFPDSNRLLFHIDDAMSWESVRNLASMQATLLIIQNIMAQTTLPESIVDAGNAVRECLNEVLQAIEEGDAT